MAKEIKQSLWAVVYVWRGIPEKVELYRDRLKAEKREKLLRHQMDFQYDETALFKVKIGGGDRSAAVKIWNPLILNPAEPEP